MSGRLTLRIRDWGDGTAELHAVAVLNKFGGEGFADFNLSALKDRAREFAKYPLAAGETVAISGGYWSKTDAKKLTQEHLYVGVTQASATGKLIMEVRLAQRYEDDDLHDRRCCSVVIELEVEYQQLQVFANELAELATRQREEVMIEAQ